MHQSGHSRAQSMQEVQLSACSAITPRLRGGSSGATSGYWRVVERRSILASFGRSRALTRGNRLSILGILVLTVLIYYAVTLAAAAIGLGTSLTNWRTLNQATLLATALAVPAGWFTSLLIKSMITSIYLESVLVKEGLRTDNLSRVFD